MNKELREIRYRLEEMAEAEEHRMWRLARKAQKHGVSQKIVKEIKDEAWMLYNMKAYPDRLLNPFQTWKFAFK